MSYLEKLKTVPLPEKKAVSPEQHRRAKFIEKLDEQIALHSAEQKGETYSKKKRVWVTQEDGSRVRAERDAQIRKWWWNDDKGVTFLQLRYGTSALEIEHGKPVIEVGDAAKLATVLKGIRDATVAGELDKLLESAAQSRKGPVRRKQ